MASTTPKSYEELRSALSATGQAHVLTFWDRLDPQRRSELLDDLAALDFNAMPALSRLASSGPCETTDYGNIAPACVIRHSQIDPRAKATGGKLISEGKVAALTVAGGQGTRLGFDGPKGAFPISPVRNKTLFQLFAESVIATARRYRAAVPWYIMTSPHNDAATRQFFAQNKNFGVSDTDVLFFHQGVMPSFDRNGKILLDQPHRLALSPDGHGGTLLALARSGMLADMARRGVEHISYFQVDNPLVYCVDPTFIGLHALQQSDMSSKTLPKADDLEKVGNFAVVNGKLTIIEYSDLAESLAHARNPDGSRTFDAANIAIHALSRRFVERLTADPASFALPWHIAHKKVPHIDIQAGVRIEPAEPNAIKLEAFIFDALPLAQKPLVVETSRAEEFSPVKNATGIDSIDTARRDMNRRAACWLRGSGVDVPLTSAGEPNGVFEISPLRSLDAEALHENPPRVRSLPPGENYYLE
jgi:UDP-N-acetylglucosamine/UDP-N-acetylgalactosamine diphosphorylase